MGGLHAHPSPSAGSLEQTGEGLRAIKISGGVLAASAALRLTVAFMSGSVGLLAAGLDDLGDVLTTIALLIAFVASARAATRRYTFGYQRLEDLAGVLVVLVIWSSVVFASVEAARKLAGEHEVTNVGIAIGAALLGLGANGVIGAYKIRVGRKIASPPLIADGKHALADALASVVAFGGLLGVRAGVEQADPIAAFVVVLMIGAVGVEAARNVLTRLLDAVDPEIIEQVEHCAEEREGVIDVGRVQARWAGRSLYVSLTVAVDPALPVSKAHDIAEAIHHHILHDVPGVAQVDVHVDPAVAHGDDAHERTQRHTHHD